MADSDHVPVAAPIDSDSAGRGGTIAAQAVVRVICPPINSSGTGFLHASGKIITAAHVTKGCAEIVLCLSDLSTVKAKIIAEDQALDLAIPSPETSISAQPLMISGGAAFAVGAHVSTWGYPGGYSGAAPMLSVGYLAAMDARMRGTREVRQWVVNAAFNSGNSGGPLLLIETGEVIGVVSSKLAPMGTFAAEALEALKNQSAGFMYNVTEPDGSTRQVSEGQIVASVLDDLRRQVQLVIGYAVLLDDLKEFLKRHFVEP